MSTPKQWAEKEIAVLRKLAGTISAPEIGKKIDRTGNAVKNKLKSLGLPSFIRSKKVAPTALDRPQPKVKGHAWRASTIIKPKVLRKKEVLSSRGYVEYCPQCYAPVSNWSEHKERMGHHRPAA